MDPENIDWNNIDSEFVEDESYESFKAPTWVDLSAPDELIEDDEAWFCTSNCKHRKTAEDFAKPKNSKVQLLRSLSVSEILPFGDRNRRDVKAKGIQTKTSSAADFPKATKSQKQRGFNFPGKFRGNSENKNPNISPLIPLGKSKTRKNNKQVENLNSEETPSRSGKVPQLKSTFSARDLFGGREILNQITEFCAEIKKFAMKGSKKGSPDGESGRVLFELKQRVRDRERTPLFVRE